jgi:hypothetical protein
MLDFRKNPGEGNINLSRFYCIKFSHCSKLARCLIDVISLYTDTHVLILEPKSFLKFPFRTCLTTGY